jgi:hypothetical protein
MDFPSYTPDYAQNEFIRLMEIWSGDTLFNVLNKWSNDCRMKFVYESLKNSNRERGYFILAMLDSYTTGLDKFKQEDDLTSKLDNNIANKLKELESLLSKRLNLNGAAPDYYYDLKDGIGKLNLSEQPEVFTPNMVKVANATRQTGAPNGTIAKARNTRALISNLSDNGFDVSKIKAAIVGALDVIFDDSENPFSINDIENCIKDLRKKGVIKSTSR